MSRDLIVVGAGGHFKDVVFIVESLGSAWTLRGVLDDAEALRGQVLAGTIVLGAVGAFREHLDAEFCVAVGDPRMRARVVHRMREHAGVKFATLIHRSASVSGHARIGEGTMIGSGASVSVDAEVGAHCILNAQVAVAHDNRVGRFCTLAPRATLSGHVICEEGVEVGSAAVVRQGLTIGRGAMVGMGAVVTKSVDANHCVAGNPARFMKSLPAFEVVS